MTSLTLQQIDADAPEGTLVIVRRDSGALLLTRTRSAVWKTCSGDPIVSVHGIAGGYSIERVYVLDRHDISYVEAGQP